MILFSFFARNCPAFIFGTSTEHYAMSTLNFEIFLKFSHFLTSCEYGIRRDTKNLSKFSANAGKYEPEKLGIRTLFMQWISLKFSGNSYIQILVIIISLHFTCSKWKLCSNIKMFLWGIVAWMSPNLFVKVQFC